VLTPPCTSPPIPTDRPMDQTRRPSPHPDPVSLVGAAMLDALELMDLPAYVLDRNGALRWANRASSRLIGDRVGHSFLAKVLDGEVTAQSLTVLDSDGRPAELRVHWAPLRLSDREIVGVFGLAVPRKARQAERAERNDGAVQLTPRQKEVLRLLGEGLSTEAIASRLGVAVETARNHIRAVLRGLGVHSRLEAVVAGRERGLLDE
jgi:DNA-binding CsgD family transcriptional regulator